MRGLQSPKTPNPSLAMWIPTEHEKYGVVIASFRGTVPYGLSLEIGDTVQILEKCDGWYRGFALKNPNIKVKIITFNHNYGIFT